MKILEVSRSMASSLLGRVKYLDEYENEHNIKFSAVIKDVTEAGDKDKLKCVSLFLVELCDDDKDHYLTHTVLLLLRNSEVVCILNDISPDPGMSVLNFFGTKNESESVLALICGMLNE